MNKRKLQEFASWAKENLEKQIELSLKKIGINSDLNIKRSRVEGDITIIDGIETTFNRQFHYQREEIIKHIKDDGFKHTIEQFASTWFNRIVALRFIEVHDYLDHGFKLFPKEVNTLPEILSKLFLVKDDLKLDLNYVEQLTSSGNNNEELYRYVLFQQCSALGKSLPMLFSSGMSYLEYFIPTPLLFGDTIINRLIEIDEEDFKEDVEIIGWLYQFYIATKKEEVFASKATITKDTLPAITQLFTPDWIVRYMAENSIGRIWLESYPSSNLKSEMNYYIDEAKQEPEVEKKLEAIRYKNVNPEDIKIVEPCSGSGHILVYCFDLLLKMYLEKGFNKKDIPLLILKNNLIGFDIDQRATQLASFALVMRARAIDNKFFSEGRYVRPKVYEIIDSKAIAHCNYNGKSYKEIIKEYNSKQWVGEFQLTDEELKSIDYLVNLFDDAKIIGSLLKVNQGDYLTIRKKLTTNLKESTQVDIFTAEFFDHEFIDLLEILRVAFYLTSKYDVMITNPPYCGTSNIDKNAKKYIEEHYPNCKADLFAPFLEVKFLKNNGYRAMITPESWMFLISFYNLRLEILENGILSIAHMGEKAFDGGFGTCAFILQNTRIDGNIKVFDLTSYKSELLKKQALLQRSNLYVRDKKDLKILPNSIVGYLFSHEASQNFKNALIENVGETKKGILSGNDPLFVRFWFEVEKPKLCLQATGLKDIYSKQYKWFPCTSGGQKRKWFGNLENVINLYNGGADIKTKAKNYRLRDTQYYFRESASWSEVGGNKFAVRYTPPQVLFGNGGPVCFSNIKLKKIIGLLNSKVAKLYLTTLAPTINFGPEQIKLVPYIDLDIDDIVDDCIKISKHDWDSFETSWEFKKHPLLGTGKLSKIFSDYKSMTISNFSALKANEEKLNDYFIKLYGLQNELTKDVDDANVTVSIANKEQGIKSLISYLVGVLMGRYSLTEEGLIYAGGVFDQSRYKGHDVDKDGIIPIYSDISVEDGITMRITGLIKEIYGIENYRDNINFVAETIGKKSNETSEETLNRYLNEGFYQDHLKTYQKRPIYWMFSSGKLSGFKCLIYMHRYNQDTLAKINASYFQPATTILRNQIIEIERQISIAGDNEKRLIDKKRLSLVEQLTEAREYGQVLDFMANKYLSIDLDDGVKVNYAKFQDIEVVTNNGKVKKDLLVPIK